MGGCYGLCVRAWVSHVAFLARALPTFLVVSLSPDQKKEGSGRGAIISWSLVNN